MPGRYASLSRLEGELVGRKTEGLPRALILCIDDDHEVLSSLTQMLEGEGYSVIRASSGRQGIRAFNAARAGNFSIDAVITDLTMPDLRGDQLAKSIKRKSPHTGIVLLTGNRSPSLTQGRLPEGIDSFLTKPTRLNDIRHALKKVLPKG